MSKQKVFSTHTSPNESFRQVVVSASLLRGHSTRKPFSESDSPTARPPKPERQDQPTFIYAIIS